ncbi:MAG: exodeoxyribonuclease VII large subunit, partial [Candidatus Methanofastidiosia archaeon]
EGKTIIVRGKINFYAPYGQISCIVKDVIDKGKGALYAQFLALKSKLSQEGLFDISEKKSIIPFPKKIAIVTSKDGAALQDIIDQFFRRNPFVELIVIPTRVQGQGAEKDIAHSLMLADAIPSVDTIILARGGGSIEELWPFNEEIVARAIAKTKKPVICGVGHEIDHTIAEFVSDIVATTPTQAAEKATVNVYDEMARMNRMFEQLEKSTIYYITSSRQALEALDLKLERKSPRIMFEQKQQALVYTSRDLDTTYKRTLEKMFNLISKKIEVLESINPLAVLERGYALVYKEGKLIRSVKSVHLGDIVTLQLKDGTLQAEIRKGDNKNGH